MAGLQEIKTRIESVKSTRQITRAMYLISASKSKKAKVLLENTRPYFQCVKKTMVEILSSSGNIVTRYISNAESFQKPLFLVLMGDKGMAGAYNGNIVSFLEEMTEENTDAEILAAGISGTFALSKKGFNVDPDFRQPVMNPTVYRARDIADLLVSKYNSGECDEIRIVYTRMVTPLTQQPVSLRLLPLKAGELMADLHMEADTKQYQVVYEPDPATVFEYLIPKYLKGMIYSALVEAFTSEQNARRTAMDNATKSADEMIDKLTLAHNRVRQAVITQELTEIVTGIPQE